MLMRNLIEKQTNKQADKSKDTLLIYHYQLQWPSGYIIRQWAGRYWVRISVVPITGLNTTSIIQ